VVGAQAGLQPLRGLAQQLIPRRMAETVVDLLELGLPEKGDKGEWLCPHDDIHVDVDSKVAGQ